MNGICDGEKGFIGDGIGDFFGFDDGDRKPRRHDGQQTVDAAFAKDDVFMQHITLGIGSVEGLIAFDEPGTVNDLDSGGGADGIHSLIEALSGRIRLGKFIFTHRSDTPESAAERCPHDGGGQEFGGAEHGGIHAADEKARDGKGDLTDGLTAVFTHNSPPL